MVKNTLILGSPRSGTHALGSHLSLHNNWNYLGEICQTDSCTDPVEDIKKLMYAETPTVAHVVQMVSKIQLGAMIPVIKHCCNIIVLRRRDKVQQFASWMYFHAAGGVQVSWLNHHHDHMLMPPQSITVTEEDIQQFLLEQMLDNFFHPDQILYYEDLDLSKSKIKKNQYAWNLQLIFCNIQFVKSRLEHFVYHEIN